MDFGGKTAENALKTAHFWGKEKISLLAKPRLTRVSEQRKCLKKTRERKPGDTHLFPSFPLSKSADACMVMPFISHPGTHIPVRTRTCALPHCRVNIGARDSHLQLRWRRQASDPDRGRCIYRLQCDPGGAGQRGRRRVCRRRLNRHQEGRQGRIGPGPGQTTQYLRLEAAQTRMNVRVGKYRQGKIQQH